jgi:hypothetical protein
MNLKLYNSETNRLENICANLSKMKKVIVRWEEVPPLLRYKVIIHFTPLNFYVTINVECKDLDSFTNKELIIQIKEVFFKELITYIEGRI